jgi:hypothetical protein
MRYTQGENQKETIAELKRRMVEAAKNLEFEKAQCIVTRSLNSSKPHGFRRKNRSPLHPANRAPPAFQAGIRDGRPP